MIGAGNGTTNWAGFLFNPACVAGNGIGADYRLKVGKHRFNLIAQRSVTNDQSINDRTGKVENN